MRRGIGVGHVQQKKQEKVQMADLGAMMTAERVAQVSSQLETLEQQLREVASKHKHEIKHDAVVRARFRQLADSLGVDLISSKKNVFAGVLGLGDFYYSLATKVVGLCMQERKFCGAYVPMRVVLSKLQREEEKALNSRDGGNFAKLTEGDIRMALDKLHVLGAGYNVVFLGDVECIQTTPDGNRGSDDVPLLNYALLRRNERRAQYNRYKPAKSDGNTDSSASPAVDLGPSAQRYRIGAAYALSNPQQQQQQQQQLSQASNVSDSFLKSLPLSDFEAQCLSLTQKNIEQGLLWKSHRAQAVLNRLVQDGSVWIDYPQEGAAIAVSLAMENEENSSSNSPSNSKHSMSQKTVSKTIAAAPSSVKKKMKSLKDEAEVELHSEHPVYWFVSIADVP